jgi:hypothetical protein
MDKYTVLWILKENEKVVRKIIADEGFPIELIEEPNCFKLVTWIKDYNPIDFLEKYWGEEKCRGMREARQDYCSIHGSKAAADYDKVLAENNYNLTIETVVVRSKPRWFKVELPSSFFEFKFDFDKNLPEIAAIKEVIKWAN